MDRRAPFADDPASPATPDILLAAPVSFLIALRYATRSGSFTSFVARVALAGLALSVAVLVLVMSIMNGFERELLGRLLGVAPHASLHFSESEQHWADVQARVRDHPLVASEGRVVRGAGMLSREHHLAGVTLVGISPEHYARISDVPDFVADAGPDFSDLEAGRFRAFLGARLAEKLEAGAGDDALLLLSEALATPFAVVPRKKRIKVLGTVRTGTEIDGYWLWMHRDDAARLLRGASNAQAIDVKLHDVMQADRVAYELALDTGALDDSWKRRFGPFYQAVISTRGVMFILLSLLIGVAAFNLVSTLVMVINSRRPDLAILHTFGASPRRTMHIAAWLGLIVGGVGTCLGLALGSLLSVLAPIFYAWLEASFGLGLMDRYFINYLPSDLEVGAYLQIAGLALSLSLLATIYPAMRARALKPADVLSNE
ncbi:MAG: ABC transporter permease [Gammaproteobacteria bacterium]|nr:ABC transporter permease [Gammaproteobacteria bacterium]